MEKTRWRIAMVHKLQETNPCKRVRCWFSQITKRRWKKIVRVYYDLTIWEEIPDAEMTEQLKNKFEELSRRLKGFGVLQYRIRPEAEEAPIVEQQPPQQQQQPPQ